MENVKLPEGWRLEKLKDLLEDKYAGEWGDEDTDNSGICVIRTTNFTNSGRLDFSNVVTRKIDKKIIEKKKLKYGDIILEKSGGSENQPVGRVVYFDKYEDNHICNNFTHVLRIYDKKAVSKYVMYFLLDIYKKGITEYFQNKTTGIRNLQMKRYLELDIVLPPLETQKKIVDVLEKAEKTLEKRKEAIKLLDELVKSRFIGMFGDPVINPKGWRYPQIEEVVADEKNAIKAGPFGSALKKEYYVESGYKIYGQEQVISGDVNFGDYYITESKYKELKNYAIKANDVLISLVGTYGKLLIIPDEYQPGIINPRLMKITFDSNIVNNIYFKYFFQSESLANKLSNNTHGGTMDILNVGIVKKMHMQIPPIELQNQFADFVKQCDKLKFEMQKSLKELEDNFNSLMQKAFNGELYS